MDLVNQMKNIIGANGLKTRKTEPPSMRCQPLPDSPASPVTKGKVQSRKKNENCGNFHTRV